MIPVHKEPIGYTEQLRLIDLSNLFDVRLSGTFNEVNVQGEKRPPRIGNPIVRDMPMKLNEFAASLTKDGLLVLCLSDGEITDYVVSSNAARTLIRRKGNKLSAQVISDDELIVNLNSLPKALKVLKP